MITTELWENHHHFTCCRRCVALNFNIFLNHCLERNPIASRLLGALPLLQRIASPKVTSPSLFISNDFSILSYKYPYLSSQLHITLKHCPIFRTHYRVSSIDISVCPLLLPSLPFPFTLVDAEALPHIPPWCLLLNWNQLLYNSHDSDEKRKYLRGHRMFYISLKVKQPRPSL